MIALVGSGNNGGDALVALSDLSMENWATCAYIVRKREEGDPLINTLVENVGKIDRY